MNNVQRSKITQKRTVASEIYFSVCFKPIILLKDLRSQTANTGNVNQKSIEDLN